MTCPWCTRTGHRNCFGEFSMYGKTWLLCKICVANLEVMSEISRREEENLKVVHLAFYISCFLQVGFSRHQNPKIITGKAT